MRARVAAEGSGLELLEELARRAGNGLDDPEGDMIFEDQEESDESCDIEEAQVENEPDQQGGT
eukprot:12047494-Heterocapsa_arctica.AAC.1